MESSVVSSLPDHTFNSVPRKHGGNHQLWGTLAEFVGLPLMWIILLIVHHQLSVYTYIHIGYISKIKRRIDSIIKVQCNIGTHISHGLTITHLYDIFSISLKTPSTYGFGLLSHHSIGIIMILLQVLYPPIMLVGVVQVQNKKPRFSSGYVCTTLSLWTSH